MAVTKKKFRPLCGHGLISQMGRMLQHPQHNPSPLSAALNKTATQVQIQTHHKNY